MAYFAVMKCAVVLLLLLVSLGRAQAQTNDVDWGPMLNSAQQWAQENLDDDVLKALQTVDRKQVEGFLQHYQDYLRGDYVLDMAQLREAAQTILPLLDAHEETQPYAAWLRARLDYFEVADDLRVITPAPKPVPNQPTPPTPNPSFKTEEEVWVKKVAPRPWPKGAAEAVPKMKAIFASERVPEALVWLAEVESGFDARAESPAGAYGMFQLMPATAKSYGLSLWPFDERRQLDPATHAAGQHLRRLHGSFKDWRLTVAAYNCGEGTVRRLMQRYKTNSYERIATHLPAETQMYVPKVEATIQLREGLALEDLKVPATAQK